MSSKNKDTEKDNEKSGDILEFSELINCILDYYTVGTTNEPSEIWKKGTDYESRIVPDEVDELVTKAFIFQLKKFTD